MFQRDSGLSYYMCEIGWFVVVDGCVLAWICWMFIVVLLVLVCLAFGCELVGGGVCFLFGLLCVCECFVRCFWNGVGAWFSFVVS